MTDLEKKLWKKTKRYLSLLRVVPFLRMVAVCNNLAMGRVKEGSDIDLFIVVKNGRLFTSRFILTGLLHLLGVRRHGKKVKERFCLSFFIDDSHLNLSPIAIDADLYLAYWIKTMRPVIDDGVAEEFLHSNNWAKEFFESLEEFVLNHETRLKKSIFLSIKKKFLEFVLARKFGDLIEKKLKSWQIKRALNKSKNAPGDGALIIGDHILKFHNVDRRKVYRDAWINKHGSRKLDSALFKDLTL